MNRLLCIVFGHLPLVNREYFRYMQVHESHSRYTPSNDFMACPRCGRIDHLVLPSKPDAEASE